MVVSCCKHASASSERQVEDGWAVRGRSYLPSGPEYAHQLSIITYTPMFNVKKIRPSKCGTKRKQGTNKLLNSSEYYYRLRNIGFSDYILFTF